MDAPAPEHSPSRRSVDVLGSRDFRFYLGARFLATTAIQMLGTAVAFQVWAISHNKLDLGILGLSQFVPIAVLSLVAGTVADRVDRRLVLFVCDVLFAVAAVALYFISAAEHPSIPVIFVVFVVLGVARAFYGPSGSALLPALVPRDRLTAAVSWQSAGWQLAAIGGPAIGGVLYAAGGPRVVYVISTIGFVVAGFMLAGIGRHPIQGGKRSGTSVGELLAGVRYIFKHKILLGSITLDFFAVFLGGATALLPVYATDVLHVGPSGLGALRAAPAIGAGITAGWTALRPLGGRSGPKMLYGVAIFGAATIVFGLSRNFVLSLFALTLLGAADMVSAVVRGTIIQAATPDVVRGRVSAVNLVFIGASNELGEFESGTLAEIIGAVPCVVVGGIGTLLVVGVWTWLFPPLRAIDRMEDVAPVSVR